MEKYIFAILLFVIYKVLGFESFIVLAITLFLYHIFYENAVKRDVYYQIESNLSMITDYIIYKMEIDLKEK